MEESVNKSLVEKTLEFHGLPLIKTWNEENGANNLNNLGIQSNLIDTSLYYARLKNLSYTDRTKRMKLHHFICSRSAVLFKKFREQPADKRIKKLIAGGK
jgi:LPS O-antigen subunit length determinant protein (WzzB/FepE family)